MCFKFLINFIIELCYWIIELKNLHKFFNRYFGLMECLEMWNYWNSFKCEINLFNLI